MLEGLSELKVERKTAIVSKKHIMAETNKSAYLSAYKRSNCNRSKACRVLAGPLLDCHRRKSVSSGFQGRTGPPNDRLWLRKDERERTFIGYSGWPITLQLPLETLASLGHCTRRDVRTLLSQTKKTRRWFAQRSAKCVSTLRV